MERRLLLLGLLRSHEMHGYQLNDFIDQHLGETVNLKRPTAYRLLNQMVEDGWVTYSEEQPGNRPTRRVFAITPEGEAAFQKILRENLVAYTPTAFPENIGLMFLDAIPAEEATELLKERRARAEGFMEMAEGHGTPTGGISLMLMHQVQHLATDLAWLDQVIAHLQSGEMEMVNA